MKIMAPAGDRERMNAAVQAGADEVYMGLVGYGARRFAGNFTVDEFIDALRFAHCNGVSVNLTLNTILSDAELDGLYDDLARLYEAGLDSVIVQDFGVARRLFHDFPDLPLHASTQMSLTRSEELNALSQRGFSRAVLARELSFDEIATIRKTTKLELEVFASGALCLCCSGKCFLSSFIGGRSGNRGMCTQPCRQLYRRETIGNSNAPREGYFLSLKDQWQGRAELEKLLELGIDSIKLEGRMKSPFYVYETVNQYRRLLDDIERSRGNEPYIQIVRKSPDGNDSASMPVVDQPDRIARLFNRGYAHGYFYDNDPDILNYRFSSNFGIEAGRTNGRYIELTDAIRNGDGIVYLDRDYRKIGGHNVSWIDLYVSGSLRPKKVESARAGQTVRFETDPPVEAVYVFKTSDYLLEKELTNSLKQSRRYTAVQAELHAKVGLPLQLTLSTFKESGYGRAFSVTLVSDSNLSESRKIAADPNELQAQMSRLGDTPFFLKKCSIDADANVFVPKAELNRLRQKAAAELEEKIVESFMRKHQVKPTRKSGENWIPAPVLTGDRKGRFAAAVRTDSQFEACQRFGLQRIYYLTNPVIFPSVLQNFDQKLIDIEKKASLLAGSLAEALEFEKNNIQYTADWFFNIGNSEAIRFLCELLPNLETITLSPEISERACKDLIAAVRTDPQLAERTQSGRNNIRLALPVYGYLPGMFTRKTLFQEEVTELISQDNRRINVVSNSCWYRPEQTEKIDATGKSDRFEPKQNEKKYIAGRRSDSRSGSTVYYGDPLNILDAVPWILESGFDEVRFDFTGESAADVIDILTQADNPDSRRYNLHSYGFGKGIF